MADYEAYVRYPAYAVKETDLALLCAVEGEEIWIPKSQISQSDSGVLSEGDHGELVITEWIAEQKGLL